MKRFLAPVLVLTLISASPSQAADQCSVKVCVNVFTDPKTGEVVITAKRNGRKPVVRKPSVRRTVPLAPRPQPTRTYKPRPRTIAKPKVHTPGPSLEDRITQLIPRSSIFLQPSGKVLTQVPTNFWTNTQARFQAKVLILDVLVGVNLVPTFSWDFGDGSPALITPFRGAPYPLTQITHTYTRAGNYTAALTISWSGTWSADGATFPVLGNNIIQVVQIPVNVVEGPTKFTR
jgi:hypothetical protein